MKKRKKQEIKRATVGERYLEVAYKEPASRDPIELQREMQKEYVDNLIQCVEHYRKDNRHDFFIVSITKREPLMPNILRNYFLARNTCPTPDYDQSAFFYSYKDEQIAYLWTVPDRDTCFMLRDHAFQVSDYEKQLLEFVLQFFDGTLLNIAKRFNKEKADTPHIDTTI